MKYLNEFNNNNPEAEEKASSILKKFQKAVVIVAVVAGLATAILPNHINESNASVPTKTTDVVAQKTGVLLSYKQAKNNNANTETSFYAFSESLSGEIFSSEHALLSVNRIEVMRRQGDAYAVINIKPYIYIDDESIASQKNDLLTSLAPYSDKIKQMIQSRSKNISEKYINNLYLTVDSIKNNGINQRVKIDDGKISSANLKSAIKKALNRMGNQIDLSANNGIHILSSRISLKGYETVFNSSSSNANPIKMLASGIDINDNYSKSSAIALR